MKKLTNEEMLELEKIDSSLGINISTLTTSLILVDKLKISKKEQEEFMKKAREMILHVLNDDERKIEAVRTKLKIANDPLTNILFGG